MTTRSDYTYKVHLLASNVGPRMTRSFCGRVYPKDSNVVKITEEEDKTTCELCLAALERTKTAG